MNKEERLAVLVSLGEVLGYEDPGLNVAMEQAYQANHWFTPGNIKNAITAIRSEYLDQQKLSAWADTYACEPPGPQKIGLIMAGNIPLVGIHDLLAVFVAGHQALIKLSSRDEVLMKFILDKLGMIEPRTKEYFALTERIQRPDAIIATGSNNSARYFEYYFGKYPHIIRKNRNSIGILTGKETNEQLEALCHDLLDFFGLGCRNISKLYVPESYDFEKLWKAMEIFAENRNHHKYMNNYDYNYAVYLLNKEKFFTNGFFILKEDTSLMSRIACANYEYYADLEPVVAKAIALQDQIQCMASQDGDLTGMINELQFGKTQQPGLFDYADGVDTMQFLTELP